MKTAALPHLFSPLISKPLVLANRIAFTAHSTGLTPDGLIGDDLSAYYEARARGGAGLIISGQSSVHPTSNSRLNTALRNWDDQVITPYRRLAQRLRPYETKMLIQLNHSGGQSAGSYDGGPPVAPSFFNYETARYAPRILTEEEILEIISAFELAARRVREGDLDGVEIHCGHGNLVQQFLSPSTNSRQDRFGGSFEARLLFAKNVLSAVRSAVGDDRIVGMRFSMEEDNNSGLSLEMSRLIIPILVEAGKLNYINVTTGVDYTAASLPTHYGPMYAKRQHLRRLSRMAKGFLNVPILSVGRVTDPRDAEDIIASGDADIVGMTRALIADRDLPTKAKSGRLNSIRYCVGANDGCLGRLFSGMSVTCIQDPQSGRENSLDELELAEQSKNITIVGGGVAGLEAARVAAIRGHRVTLLEKSNSFGGLLQLARMAPGREEIGAIADQLLSTVEKLNVNLKVGQKATAESIVYIEPDAVVLATGAQPSLPDLEDEYDRIVTVQAAMEGAMVGGNVAVLDLRGDMIGVTTADWLAFSGRQTSLITPFRFAGHLVDPMTWQMLHQRLLKGGVNIFTNSDLISLTDYGIEIRSNVSGETSSIMDVASVVVSGGGVGRTDLANQLRKISPGLPIKVVGDAVSPRNIEKAIWDGHLAGRAL